MPHVQSFAPLADCRARVLVLGSMPSEASLRAGEYYAHPRNAFWPIMGQLLGFDPGVTYSERVRQLTFGGIAVWDVLATCHRSGSLDSDIDDASITVNDFAGFFRDQPLVSAVFFNGAKAESCFRKGVQSHLPVLDLTFQRLPSTSPANAAMSLEKKRQAWEVICRDLRSPS